MEVKAEDFTNNNENFSNVKFVIVDGGLTINASAEEVVVTITEHSATETYDGTEKSVTGYTVTDISNELYTEDDFTFNGTAEAKGTEVGFYPMEVKAEDFTNNNKNFSNVKFVIVDGGLTIEKRPVMVTVNNETYKYDGYLKTVADDNGQEYTVEGESEGRGLLNGDDISLNVVYGVYADEAQSLVGQYTADVKDGSIVISNANGDVTKNYAVTVVPGWLVITDGTEDDPVNPDAVLTKTHLAGVYDLGDVTFTITVKNIYNEAKTITIREQPGVELIGADEEGKIVYQDVPAGEQVTAYAKYTITEADILEGTFTNHVTAEFSDAKTYTNEDTVDIADLDTTLTVVKSSGVPEGGTASLGETINYTITVTNDGNVSYTGVKVVDDLAGLKINEDTRYTVNEDGTVTVGDLAVGETVVITASYVVTSDDIKAGHVLNTVTATGDSIDDPKNPDKPKTPEGEDEEDDETDDLDTTLTVVKTSDVAEGATVGLGETINYTITVKNDGNVPYTGVKVVDDLAGLQIHEDARYTVEEDGTVTVGDLAVGETVTITASYIVTSDDIKAGHVLNAVTAAGDPIEDPKNPDEPKKPEGEDEEDDETDDLDTTLTVVKTSDVAEGATVGLGETINYTITVKNDGNVPYTGVVVEDYLTNLVIDESARYTVNGDGTVTIGNLAVGETVTITASYEVTSDDIEAGHVLNTATAAGDPIDDPKNPEEPQKPEGEDKEDDETDDLDTTLTVVKTSNVPEGATVGLGDTIIYTFTVTNDGNVPYTGVSVVDALDGLKFTSSSRYWVIEDNTAYITKLAVGETVWLEASYVVTSDDIKAGHVLNMVTATADPIEDPNDPENPKKPEGKDEEDDETDDLDTTLTVVKTSDVAEGATVGLGETINYTITVKNDGNVPYTGVKVVDDLAGLQIHEDARYTVEEDGTVTVGDLAVGETVTITASYIVTSDDIKAGHVLNAVTAAGDPIEDPKNPDEPKKPEGEDEEDDETDDLDTTLTVTKSSDVAEGATVGLGETINYTITVKNDGNVPYTGVKVVDDLAGLQIHEDARYTVEEDGTVTVGDLAVGETVTITASYIVTSDDIKAGHVLNAVTAAGDPIEDPKNPEEPKKPEGENEEDDETDDLDTTLTVVKTSDVAEGEVAKEGQTIHYTITVTNEGNVPYTDVTVIDDMEGLVIDANDRYAVQEDGTITVGDLAVGETVTITASYTVTADDILVGTVVNAATVSGEDVEDPKNPDEPKTPEGGDETEVTLAVDVPVTVHWVDGDQFYRPTAALTVQLIGNDGVVMDEVVVDPTTMGTDWTYTFENMPTHDENGDLIVYSVLEPVAPGNGRYDVTYNGLEVTNTAYVTVTFVDWNGAVLQNERILVGATGTVPESPRRVGYNFTQWSGGSWENVTRDQIIHANYMTVYEAIDELNIPLAGGTIQNVGDCFD